MSDILRRHWSTVFAAEGIDDPTLQNWLAEDDTVRRRDGPRHANMADFRIRRQDVERAVRIAKNSSPGPDGIPYGAWRALGSLAIDALRSAMRDLASVEGERLIGRGYPDFNESLAFFLPKNSTVSAHDGSPAYEAQNVRPLNVTNCDNRLIASAVRIALEPNIAPHITTSSERLSTGTIDDRQHPICR